MNEKKKNFYKITQLFLIIIVTVLVTIYVIEFFLIFKSRKANLDFQKKIENIEGYNFDKRSKLEVYKELISKNENTATETQPYLYLSREINTIFPLSGLSNSQTLYCNENGYYSIYQSDRYGFNNPDYEWDKEKIAFLLLGDSFTQGACVNRPNDIASVLRTLSKEGVLNLGYAGNGPLIEYATLVEYISPNVKNILWLYYEANDLVNLEAELKSTFLVKYLNDIKFKQNLQSQQNLVDDLSKSLIVEAMKKENDSSITIVNKSIFNFFFKYLEYFKLNNLRYLFKSYSLLKHVEEKNLKNENHFFRIIKLANDLALRNDSKLYFVYLPSIQRYMNNKNFNQKSYNKMKIRFNDLDIPFLDMHQEVFKKIDNPLELFPFTAFGDFGRHYNVEGYKKISDAIYRNIKKLEN